MGFIWLVNKDWRDVQKFEKALNELVHSQMKQRKRGAPKNPSKDQERERERERERVSFFLSFQLLICSRYQSLENND